MATRKNNYARRRGIRDHPKPTGRRKIFRCRNCALLSVGFNNKQIGRTFLIKNHLRLSGGVVINNDALATGFFSHLDILPTRHLVLGGFCSSTSLVIEQIDFVIAHRFFMECFRRVC